MQVSEAKEILAIGSKEVTILGVLLLIIAGLCYGLVYYVKKYNKAMEDRVNDNKDYTKVLIEINDENHELSNKVLMALEILKTLINVSK